MGNKTRDLAASVPWANMQAAILANPQRGVGLGLSGASGAVAFIGEETLAVFMVANSLEMTIIGGNTFFFFTAAYAIQTRIIQCAQIVVITGGSVI